MTQPLIRSSALDTSGNVTAHGGTFSTHLFSGSTTSATPTEIFIDSVTNSRFVLANNASASFTLQLVAKDTVGGAVGDSASFLLHGFVKRIANAAATSVTVAVVDSQKDQAAWAIAATADTTNGALIVTVTGEAAKTIQWRGVLQVVAV